MGNVVDNSGDRLLLVEAINIDSLIEDTGQLSVRRGGSMAMREAARCVVEVVREICKDRREARAEPVRTGGSLALIRISGITNEEAGALVKKVRQWLCGDADGYQHPYLPDVLKQVCFSVAITPASGNIRRDINILRAITRRTQLESPDRFFLDTIAPDGESRVCTLEGFRPATSKIPDGRDEVSLSVQQRFRYGNAVKNDFVNRELGLEEGYEFVRDFEELSESSRVRPGVNRKMAVVYFDGNDFGKYQQALDPEQLKEFDREMEIRRRDYLRQLTQWFSGNDTTVNNRKLRLEILQWGGDEVLLVVPGWVGFSAVRLFYHHMSSLAEPRSGKALTHAGGLVFCSHKTPIQTVTALARELAEYAKMFSREVNLYFPMLLESEDYPVKHVKEHWQDRYHDFGGYLLPVQPVSTDIDRTQFRKIEDDNLKGLFRRWVVGKYAGKDVKEAEEELSKSIDIDSLTEACRNCFQCVPESVVQHGKRLDLLHRHGLVAHYHDTLERQPFVQTLEYFDYLLSDPFLEKTP